MKTIILCGGIGTRLKEETEFKPKPMVYIGDKPFIWHIMKIYSHYGFNDFIFALGYKGEQIKDYFSEDSHKEHFNITFVNTGLKTLIGERILTCKDYIPKEDENFMVTYGDGVSDLNLKNVLVTGSEGYIGAVLVPKLVKSGYKVTGLDICYYKETLGKCESSDYQLIREDIRN